MAVPVIASTNTYTGTGTSHTVSLPSGTSSGDLLLCFMNSWGATGASWNDEAGWTTIVQQTHSSDGSVILYAKIAGGGEGNPTFDSADHGPTVGRILRITGHAGSVASAVVAYSSQESLLDDPKAPGLYVPVDEGLVIYGLFDTWGDADSYTIPGGTTSIGTQDNSDATSNLAYIEVASASFVPPGTYTGTSGNDDFGSITVAIGPTSAPSSYTDSVILSVEKVTLTFSGAASVQDQDLTLGQNWQNCTPFMSTREAGAAVTDAFANRLTNVAFSDNAGTANVAAALTTGDDIQLEIFVVEWDPTKVNVQQHGWSITAGNQTNGGQAITSVDLSKSFLIHSARQTSVATSADEYQEYITRCRFTSSTGVVISRIGVSGALQGNFWVVECIGSEFSVQSFDFSSTSSATTTDQAISSVDMSKTFLVGSYITTEAQDDPRDGTHWWALTSSTNIQLQRLGGGSIAGTTTAQIYAVTCSGDEWRVQRDQNLISASVTTLDVGISAIDTASAAIIPGTDHHHTMPHMSTTTGASTGLLGFTFSDDRHVRASRRATTTAGYHTWEVVDFTLPSNETVVTVEGTSMSLSSVAPAVASGSAVTTPASTLTFIGDAPQVGTSALVSSVSYAFSFQEHTPAIAHSANILPATLTYAFETFTSQVGTSALISPTIYEYLFNATAPALVQNVPAVVYSGAYLTGNNLHDSDYQFGLISVWFRRTGFDAVIAFMADSANRVSMWFGSNNTLNLRLSNNSAGAIYHSGNFGAGSIITDTDWHHVILAWDSQNITTGSIEVFLDGIDLGAPVGGLNSDVDLNRGSTWGASPGGTSAFQGEMAQVYMNFNLTSYFNLNYKPNRDRFYDSVNHLPRALGLDGTDTGLPQPDHLLNTAAATYGANAGTDDDWTTNNTFSDAATSPGPEQPQPNEIAVLVPVVTVTFTSVAPQVGTSAVVLPGTFEYFLESFAPSLSRPVNVQPTGVSYSFEANAPAVASGAAVAPDGFVYTFSGHAPSLQSGAAVLPSAFSYALQAFTPSVASGAVITPTAFDYAFLSHTPSLATGALVLPSLFTFTMVSGSPVIGTGTIILPNTYSLALLGIAPTVASGGSVLPATATFTMVSGSPHIASGASVLPTAFTYTLVELPPSFGSGVIVDPQLYTFGFTGHTPSVQSGAAVAVPTTLYTFDSGNAVVGTGTVINSNLFTYNFDELAPGVASGKSVLAPLTTLGFEVTSPVTASGAAILPVVHTFTLQEYSPNFNVGTDIAVPLSVFSFTPFAPGIASGVSILTPVTNFNFVTVDPVLNLGVSILPSIYNFNLVTGTPEIAFGSNILAPQTLFGFEGLPPVLNTGASLLVPVTLYGVDATPPSAASGANVEPPSFPLTLVPLVPTIDAHDVVQVLIPAYTFGFTGYAPSISARELFIRLRRIRIPASLREILVRARGTGLIVPSGPRTTSAGSRNRTTIIPGEE